MFKRFFKAVKGKEEIVTLPEYSTENAAGADFFSSEEVVIPSFPRAIRECRTQKPVFVKTGVKAKMENDESLLMFNRSSGPTKKGLILANSVGVVDADYFECEANDGEIMFAFYNFTEEDVIIAKGEKIGQGIFYKYLRPDDGETLIGGKRVGGFGSTGN